MLNRYHEDRKLNWQGKESIRVKIEMHQYVELRGLLQENIGSIKVHIRTNKFNLPYIGYKLIVVTIVVTMFW